MKITSEQVVGSRFHTVRLREGYEMGPVDDFIDKVAVTLAEYEGHPEPEKVLEGVPSPDVRPQMCPTDGAKLAEDVHRGVRIAHCPNCGGVFLDRGALSRLIALAGQDGGEGSAAWLTEVFRAVR